MRRTIARILRTTADRIAPTPAIVITAHTKGFSLNLSQVERELLLRGGLQ